MTMATSVEGRVPFLDHALVEYALHMPSHFKYKNNTPKYILKKAAEGIIPHEVIYRKKMGFAAPTMRWFKEGIYFKPYFRDMLHTKEKEWGELLNIENISSLFEKNQTEANEYSMLLWTIQNVMACNISESL
jgi:asparagine synthase (glutamine-hydrolysing)